MVKMAEPVGARNGKMLKRAGPKIGTNGSGENR